MSSKASVEGPNKRKRGASDEVGGGGSSSSSSGSGSGAGGGASHTEAVQAAVAMVSRMLGLDGGPSADDQEEASTSFKAFADDLQGKLFSPQDKARETVTTLIQHNGDMRELVRGNDKLGKPSQAPAYALVADLITGRLEHIYLDDLLKQLAREVDGVVVLLDLLALMSMKFTGWRTVPRTQPV